jgi:Lipid A core - O-antigen ligase and related enzymes
MTIGNKIAYFLIYFVVIFTALAYGTVHQPIIALFYLLVAALTVLWAIDGLVSGSVRFSPSPLQLPIYAAAAYGFVQIIPFGSYSQAGVDNIHRTLSLDPFSTEMNAVHFLALGLFLSVTLTVLDRADRIRRIVMVLTIFGFIFAFFAILQGVLSPTKIYGIYERQFAQPYGSFVNRHNFAAYMEMLVALPTAFLLTGVVKRDQRLLYLTAIVLMAVSLFLSGSRGGLVALVVELILLVMLTTPVRGTKKLVVRLALAAALLIAVVAGTFLVGGESSLTRIAESASSKDVSTNRTHIWSVTVDVIKQNLPFGAGLGAFGVAYTPTDDRSGLERAEQAHNDYLQTLSDAGVVGLLIGGAFLFLLVRTALRNVRRQNDFRRAVAVGATAGIFAVLVHSVFDFVLHTTAVAVLFLLLIALLVAAGNKYEDDLRGDDLHRRRRKGSVHPLRSTTI